MKNANMKSYEANLPDEVLALCVEALKLEPGEGFFHAAWEEGRVAGITGKIDFVYANPHTPFYLEKLGIVEILDVDREKLPYSIRQSLPSGYCALKIDFDKMRDWVTRRLGGEMGNEKVVVFPEGGDFTYTGERLYLKGLGGSPCVLDFSAAPTLRPVFESFFRIFESTGNPLMTSKEVSEEYKRITGTTLLWRLLSQRKSSIVGKMIKPKQCLRDRIVWEYDAVARKHRFEILPLSDTSSDNLTTV